MADSRRHQPGPQSERPSNPSSASNSDPPSFLHIREAIDFHSPMTSVPSTPPSPRSVRSGRFTPAAATDATGEDGQRLSIITEDGDTPHVPNSTPAPPVPPRSTHRPFSRRWRDAPPRASSDLQPPDYTTFDDGKVRRDRLNELRNKPVVARRGGWKRLLIIILLVLVVLGVALGVGLGVGLTRNKNSSDSGSSSRGSPSSGSNNNQTFPAGQFSISTNLENTTTACTANSNTFRCTPSSSYSFNWIITGSDNKYQIYAPDNPFALTFPNTSLTLVDVGSANERYTFSIPVNLVVTPNTDISGDNHQSECFYNGTTLSAALYTKRAGMVGRNGTAPDSQSAWQPWPYAAEVNETISGGNNVPACYEVTNGQQGSRITNGLPAQPSTSQCGCFYRNYNL